VWCQKAHGAEFYDLRPLSSLEGSVSAICIDCHMSRKEVFVELWIIRLFPSFIITSTFLQDNLGCIRVPTTGSWDIFREAACVISCV
jgi:hypothetical protein